MDDICSTHVIFWGLVYIFQTCILMCIMCLMQTLNSYAIQLQLHHCQLYTYQHVIKVVTTTRTYCEHMTWWLMKIIFKIGVILRLENSMYTLLRFLWHKQCHGVHVFQFLDIF
jgi:hypothetical protein